MEIRRPRKFELRLGKVGFVLFTFGISCLLLIAFVLGVMVGKNIETYPEKITGAIPGLVREKIAAVPVSPQIAVGPEEAKEAAKEDRDVKLTFYNNLSARKEFQDGRPGDVAVEKPEAAKGAAAKEAPKAHENYVLRVASLKDEGKAKELQRKLSLMGYKALVEVKELKSGTYFRVIVVGLGALDEAEKAADHVQKETKAKCIVAKETGP